MMAASSFRFLLLVVLLSIARSSPSGSNPLPDLARALHKDPDENRDTIQLIRSRGYPAEAHWVQTTDGYILGLHRIPNGRNSTSTQQQNAGKDIVFLQHGLLCSSSNWVSNYSPSQNLGFLLADAGYDVWMGNIRGNTYSANHTSLKTDSREFWEFSWDEHTQKDLPAMLDYVLAHTGQDSLHYLGHSQGTTMGFAGFSSNKTLASRIKTFFALAPVTTIGYVKGALAYLSKYFSVIKPLLELDHGRVLSNSALLKFFEEEFCPEADYICENIIFLICGFDRNNINETRIPVYYAHTPAATSVQNLDHWQQEVKSDSFQMYDYGSSSKNKEHYGVPTPPLYNASQLTVPTVLFTGGNDTLADPTDVAHLKNTISNGVIIGDWNIPKYEHLDFIWGLDANTQVYDKVIAVLKSQADQD